MERIKVSSSSSSRREMEKRASCKNVQNKLELDSVKLRIRRGGKKRY